MTARAPGRQGAKADRYSTQWRYGAALAIAGACWQSGGTSVASWRRPPTGHHFEEYMIRHGSAVWNGTIKEGSGTVSTPSGVLNNTPYSFKLRFEDESGTAGTNPEELIAAAHAGCFSMALSGQLTRNGFTAESLATSAALTLEQKDGGFAITKVHLTLDAKVPGGCQGRLPGVQGAQRRDHAHGHVVLSPGPNSKERAPHG
jgi:lipoyl-dependent peroxiredoxin